MSEKNSISVELLGSVQVQRHDQIIPIHSGKVRTLLAMLALHAGSPVSAETLIDELWGQNPPGKSRNALQAAVARLRRQLHGMKRWPGDGDAELVRTASMGYLLDLPSNAVDTYRFSSLASEGGRYASSDPARAIPLLRAALALWRGPALFGADAGMRCAAAVARLWEIRLCTQEDLFAAQLAVGDYREPLSELRQLAPCHPERERLAELLMIALYLSGQQAQALSEFHRARTWLLTELGLQPGPALHRLQQAILQQQTTVPNLLWSRAV